MPVRSCAAVFVVSGVVLAGCGEPVTATLVRVDARDAVRGVASLEVTMSNNNATLGETFQVEGRDFPLTFTIETPGRTGALEVDLRALDVDARPAAFGAGATTIETDEVGEVRVLLEPADFPVNTIYTGAQRLSFFTYMAGTQMAVGPDGSFTVGFADDCAVAGRCDVWGRRFDTRGAPQRTDIAISDAQFNLNRSDVFGNDPALAVNRDGVMLAVWTTFDDILAEAITPSGAAATPVETLVSTGSAPTSPAVTALPDGRFLVVWIETDLATTDPVLRGRILDAGGAFSNNPVTGNVGVFTISTDVASIPETPAVASDGNGLGVGIIWRSRSSLRMRFLTTAGQLAPATEATIQSYSPLTAVWGPAIAPTLDRFFVVTWAIRTQGGDADDGAVVARRLAATAGAPIGVDAVVARGLADSASRVALAHDGERFAVAWHACTTPGDGAGCGVFAQQFHDRGLPVGAPFVLNTTIAGDQITPSLVALPGEAWAASWSDASLAPPDSSEAGVRARIIYQPFASAQGVLGAACGGADDAACPATTACLASADGAPRCHRACDANAALPCPEGGVCTTTGELSACIF